MSAYYKFTINDRITMIWFKEDINSNSPMDLCNLGNYFDRVRQQIIYVMFKSVNGDYDIDVDVDVDVVSFTGNDFGNDEPLDTISAKMHSDLDLKIIHGDRESDIEYFRLLIHVINDICEKNVYGC